MNKKSRRPPKLPRQQGGNDVVMAALFPNEVHVAACIVAGGSRPQQVLLTVLNTVTNATRQERIKL